MYKCALYGCPVLLEVRKGGGFPGIRIADGCELLEIEPRSSAGTQKSFELLRRVSSSLVILVQTKILKITSSFRSETMANEV